MTDEEVKHVLSALKPLVHDAQKYNALMAYLDYRVKREHKSLEDLTDPIQIHRSQGKVHALRVLKRLREEVMSLDSN